MVEWLTCIGSRDIERKNYPCQAMWGWVQNVSTSPHNNCLDLAPWHHQYKSRASFAFEIISRSLPQGTFSRQRIPSRPRSVSNMDQDNAHVSLNYALDSTCAIAALLAVILRFVARSQTKAKIALDDWLAVAGLICYLAWIAVLIQGLHWNPPSESGIWLVD